VTVGLPVRTFHIPIQTSDALSWLASSQARQSAGDSKKIGSTRARVTRGPARPSYLIWSYTLNIGMYIEITMKPTMPPTMMIISGSRIDVSAFSDAATSSS
jgi:hypothetical protein